MGHLGLRRQSQTHLRGGYGQKAGGHIKQTEIASQADRATRPAQLRQNQAHHGFGCSLRNSAGQRYRSGCTELNRRPLYLRQSQVGANKQAVDDIRRPDKR